MIKSCFFVAIFFLLCQMIASTPAFSDAGEKNSDNSWFFSWDNRIDTFALDNEGALVFCDNEHNVGKIDADGRLVWSTKILPEYLGGNARGLFFDVNNDILITYWLTILGGQPKDNDITKYTFIEDAYSFCIIKLNSDGDFLWARSWRSSECCEETGLLDAHIASDNQCNVYMTGRFWSEIDINPGLEVQMFYCDVTNRPNQLVKLSSNGDFIWARLWVADEWCSFDGIHCDDDNQLIIVGDFVGSLDIDPGSAEYFISPIKGKSSNLILTLDSDGQFVNCALVERIKYDFDRNIDWDSQQNSFYFGLGRLKENPDDSKKHFQHVSKLSTDGILLWQIEYEAVEEYMISRRYLTSDSYLYFLSKRQIKSAPENKSSKSKKSFSSEYNLYEYLPDGTPGCTKTWIQNDTSIEQIVVDLDNIYFSGLVLPDSMIDIGSILESAGESRYFILKTSLDSL